MKRIGIEPGEDFVFATAPKEVQDALNAAPAAALPAIKRAWRNAGVLADGWRVNRSAIGTYGADYLHRAGDAYGGLGANVIEDAVYPIAFADENGDALGTSHRICCISRKIRFHRSAASGRLP